MGMNLLGDDELYINCLGWSYCLRVATLFGWRPQGTAPPPADLSPHGRYDEDWEGMYYGNSFQEVTETDAKQLSEALYRAVEKIEHGHKLTSEQQAIVIPGSEYLLKELAKHAGKGSFLIG